MTLLDFKLTCDKAMSKLNYGDSMPTYLFETSLIKKFIFFFLSHFAFEKEPARSET